MPCSRPSEVIRGNSSPSARGHQRSSEGITGDSSPSARGHQRSSEVIRGNSSPSARGHQRSSEVIRGDSSPSVAIKCCLTCSSNQAPSSAINGNQSQSSAASPARSMPGGSFGNLGRPLRWRRTRSPCRLGRHFGAALRDIAASPARDIST